VQSSEVPYLRSVRFVDAHPQPSMAQIYFETSGLWEFFTHLDSAYFLPECEIVEHVSLFLISMSMGDCGLTNCTSFNFLPYPCNAKMLARSENDMHH